VERAKMASDGERSIGIKDFMETDERFIPLFLLFFASSSSSSSSHHAIERGTSFSYEEKERFLECKI